MNRKDLGNIGENIASDYLRSKGFRVIERNFSCRMGEIDIIAKKGDDIYFVEVKTRKDNKFGHPFESITLNKQRQILKIAKYYLLGLKKEVDCHLSVIGITLNKSGKTIIDFLEDAFQIS